MSDPMIEITAPAAVPSMVRAREGIAAALLLSLALHAVVILGLSEWFEEGADSPSIIRATLARASGPPATSAPPSSTAESEGESPVSEPLPDTRDAGTNLAAETSQRPLSNAIATKEGNSDTPESPWQNLDYAATVRQIAGLDAQDPGGQPRVRRIVEDRAETPEDNWYLELLAAKGGAYRQAQLSRSGAGATALRQLAAARRHRRRRNVARRARHRLLRTQGSGRGRRAYRSPCRTLRTVSARHAQADGRCSKSYTPGSSKSGDMARLREPFYGDAQEALDTPHLDPRRFSW